jgi:hypothetical protein
MFECNGLGDLGLSLSINDLKSGFKKLTNVLNPINLPKNIMRQVTKNRPTISLASVTKMNKNIVQGVGNTLMFKKPAIVTVIQKAKRA